MAFLKKFFKNLGKKGDSVLGIDISPSTIKVVQLKNKGGRAVLETYGEIALGPYFGAPVGHATALNVEEVSEALRDLLAEAKTTTLNSGIAIPYSSSLIQNIKMPAVGEKKLAEMVPIESRKFIPVPISEVLLDWSIIPRGYEEDDGEADEIDKKSKDDIKYRKVDVLVVAIHKDTISRFQNISDSVGLETSFLEIEVFSTIRAVLRGEPEPIMIFDFGADTTKIFIVENRILRDTHIINRGAQDITSSISKSMTISDEQAERMKREHGLESESEEGLKEASAVVLDSILAEAKQVMLSYQKRENTSIVKTVLTGGGSSLKGLPSYAEKVFETDIFVADPFSKIETPAFLEDVLREAGPEFSVAIGVALRKLDEMSG